MGAILNCVALDGRLTKHGVDCEFRHLYYQSPEPTSPYEGTWRMIDYIQETDLHFETISEAVSYISEHAEKWYFGLMVKVKTGNSHSVSMYDEEDEWVEYGDTDLVPRDKAGYFWLFGAWLAC